MDIIGGVGGKGIHGDEIDIFNDPVLKEMAKK